MVENDLDTTLKLLAELTQTSACQVLSARSKMPYGTWPKELFTEATEVRRLIEPFMFSKEQYLVLLTLFQHDILSVASKRAKMWRKLPQSYYHRYRLIMVSFYT